MFKVTYYDPHIWQEEEVTDEFDTLKEAKVHLQSLIELHPPRYHGAYAKIEKVDLIENYEYSKLVYVAEGE